MQAETNERLELIRREQMKQTSERAMMKARKGLSRGTMMVGSESKGGGAAPQEKQKKVLNDQH